MRQTCEQSCRAVRGSEGGGQVTGRQEESWLQEARTGVRGHEGGASVLSPERKSWGMNKEREPFRRRNKAGKGPEALGAWLGWEWPSSGGWQAASYKEGVGIPRTKGTLGWAVRGVECQENSLSFIQ